MTKTPPYASADDQAQQAAATKSTPPKTRKAPKKKSRRPKGTGSIFEFRGGCRAEITLPNGEHRVKDFPTDAAADEWLRELLVQAKDAARPELGGPSKCTLAEMMWHYAHIYTVNKGGAAAELNRIGHYLRGAGFPLLKLVKTGGRKELVQVDWRQEQELPSAFEEHRDNRLTQRAKTYKAIAELANTRVSQITKAKLETFESLMQQEGLSGSTIQKEIALLKAMFNKAIDKWNWVGFANPAVGIKLAKPKMKFVRFTKKDDEALQASLAKCDNPLFPLLVETAISSLARRESLLRLRSNDVDLDARTMHLRSKTGEVVIHLSQRAVEILRRVPVSADGRYFPMTPSAVDNAWDAARARAGLTHLTYHDLRHIGATYYVRKGISAHVLQQLLGHKTPRQAQAYVNLVGQDVLEALDRAESSATQRGDLPPAIQGSAKEEMNRRRAERLNAVRMSSGAAGQAAEEAKEEVIADAPSVHPATPVLTDPSSSGGSGAAPQDFGANVVPFVRKVANG